MKNNDTEDVAKAIHIDDTTRQMLLDQMQKDSLMLCEHALIDYSVCFDSGRQRENVVKEQDGTTYYF